MKMYKLLGALMLLMASIVLQAQEKNDSVMKFSLAEAQNYALTNNKSILNAQLDIESAKLKVWETTAIGLPQVSAKLPFQYTPTLSPLASMIGSFPGVPKSNPDDLKWTLNADITVSQLIFSGSYIVGLQSAKVYQSLSKLSGEKSKQDVLELVTTSYFNVLVAMENREILDSTYQNMRKTLANMESMNKQGFIVSTIRNYWQTPVRRKIPVTIKNKYLEKLFRMGSSVL